MWSPNETGSEVREQVRAPRALRPHPGLLLGDRRVAHARLDGLAQAVERLQVAWAGDAEPPDALKDGSYYGRRLGHGKGYIYPHEDPRGFDVDYLPDELKGKTYYRPSGNGEEADDSSHG